jgi:hypothetical protein
MAHHVPALCSLYTDTQVARTHSGSLNLTADIVARIYTRQITNWNDPTILQSNPHLRYAGPITVPFSLSLSLFLVASASYAECTTV